MAEDFSDSWAITTRHLEAARRLLPNVLQEFPIAEEGSVLHFEEFLAHNELELALDELVGLGSNNTCPIGFWLELLAAADNMGLEKHSAELCARLADVHQS